MIEFKTLTPTARPPEGVGVGFMFFSDLHSIGESVWVYPGARQRISTGVQISLPEDTYMRFIPHGKPAFRESMAIMIDTVPYEPGLHDLELMFINHGDTKVAIPHGARIALGLLTPVVSTFAKYYGVK